MSNPLKFFTWTGAAGPNWDSAQPTSTDQITNWNSGGKTDLVPTADTGDVARFDDGGVHSVGGGGSADSIDIANDTTVTLTDSRFTAGASQPENNAGFPFDLSVDDSSKLIIASGAGMQNQGSVSLIALGDSGPSTATMEVDPGGLFESHALSIGDGPFGTGIVTVNDALGFGINHGGGPGNGALTIGNQGTGSLSISGTPLVFTESASLGVNQGAVGTMSLDSSIWGGGNVTIGAAGTGHMTIGAGATVSQLSMVLGSAQGASGDLLVTGTNSFSVDFLTVGAAGTGTATFGAGSNGTFADVSVGDSASASANMTMDGATWTTSSLTVGGATGTGHATAGAGEVVTVNGNAVLGEGQTASGDLTVDAATLNGGTISIGHDGTGSLAIESGLTGSVAAVVIGEDQGSSGTLTIDSSNWNAGSLTVGPSGTGQATVETGSTAALDNILIGPTGVLAVTETAGSVATVIAQQVTIGFGTLDLSGSGRLLIGTALGDNGAVAIGNNSSLTGLGSLKGNVILNGGLVVANLPLPGALKIDGGITGAGTVQPLMTLEANGVIDPGVEIAFSPSIGAQVGDLVLDVPGGEQGTITGFSAGNTIDIKGTAFTAAVFTQGTSGAAGTLTLSGGGSAPLSLAVLGDYAADAFTASPVTASGAGIQSASFALTAGVVAAAGPIETIVTVVPCFVSGTGIATPLGKVNVEELRVGQEVRCLMRGTAPIVWIGRHHLDLRRHPTPDRFWPVRVSRDAIADGAPSRDLYLSPDHALFANGVLIPVRHLINGTTIARVPVDVVTYYHVELARHDVLWAEGVEVESYLDTVDRRLESGPRSPRSMPALTWETLGCANLIVTGRELEAMRQKVNQRASPIVA